MWRVWAKMRCTLRELAIDMEKPPCDLSKIDRHHVLSRQLLASRPDARRLVEGKYSEYFIKRVCNVHNAQTKLADNPIARGYMILQTPRFLIEPALDEIRLLYTSVADQNALRWEALVEDYRQWLIRISHPKTMSI